MALNNSKPNKFMAACAVGMAAVVGFGSIFAVAAAATAPDENVNTAAAETTEKTVYDYLNGDGDFHVLSAYEVTVVNGDDTVKLLSNGGKVSDILEQAGVELGEKQISYPAADSEISGDCEVRVLDAKPVSITADGETKKVLLPDGTVEEALKLGSVKLGKDDILDVKRTTPVSKVDSITIKRVTYKDETVSESIPFDKVKENSDKLDLGESEIKTEGVDGEKAVVKRVKYIDGERDSSETIAEKVVRKPVDEVTLVGTKGAASADGAGTFTDENGVEVSYKYKLTGSGTAYTAPAGASTATGTPVYEGGVAINPNLIPYGSKLYIESTDGSHVYGYAKAIDTGGALMDGSAIVDVFYFSLDSCYSWGRRDVNVYVIE